MRRSAFLAAAIATVTLAAACVGPTPVALAPSPVSFIVHDVATGLALPAFTTAADLDNDGVKELIVTQFVNSAGGPGKVTIFTRGADLDTWTGVDIVNYLDGIKFPHEPAVADLNLDGLADIVIPGGFFSCEFSLSPCGSLQWFEQLPAGGWTRHQIVPNGASQFYFRTVLVDFDNDGILDIVTGAETSSTAQISWFKGTTGVDRFETTPRLVGYGGGSLPAVADIDGDGDLDVISGELFGGSNTFAWFERTADPSPGNPDGTFAYHAISTLGGGGFQPLLVPDLLGDSVARWVGTNHVNAHYNGGAPESAVFRLDPTATITDPWNLSVISQGILARDTTFTLYAPGVIGAGDIDGDGLKDLAVSGDGDQRLFWLKQMPDHSFQTYVIADGMGQSGGAVVDDLDGNGKTDIVFSSYEAGAVRIYSTP